MSYFYDNQKNQFKNITGTFLMVSWLRFCFPMQGFVDSIPGWGVKIPYVSRPKTKNIKQKQYCNKFNKDLKKKKVVHIKKNVKKKEYYR